MEWPKAIGDRVEEEVTGFQRTPGISPILSQEEGENRIYV